jgi:hypothetical protein
MQLRFLAYAAISVPVCVAAFVAGIVFERQRVQTSSVQQPSAIATTPGQPATISKAQQDPVPQPKQASRQEKITQGMQEIEAAWRTAIDSERLLAVKIGPCYGARFIRRGADVRVDLAKLDSLADLDVGVIRISGMTAVNRPTGRYTCFGSIAEALAANRQSSESLEPVLATLTYKVSNTEIRLDRIESDPGWLAIAVNDNVRLKLGSWEAVSTQPIDLN